MCKNRLFAVALGVLLAVSSFAQTNQNQANEEYPKAGFFFGAGMSHGIFTSDKLSVYSDFDLLDLNPVKVGVYYELPLGIGNFFGGLEGGFASGSSFGGAGDVSFLPINLNATFAFGIANIIYIGPSLKAGALALLGHDKYKVMPLLGAGLDLELRYKYFPLSIYAQGGVNAYPTSYSFSILPTVEAGLRFPRGAFRGSGQSSAQPRRSTQSGVTAPPSGQPAAAAPAASAPSTAPAATAPSAAATVSNVTVTPGIVTVPQGSTQQFNASVTGTNNPPQNVTWSVTGGGAGTSISPSGLLTIGANQAPGPLTVRATSTADTSRSGTATVTVPAAAGIPPASVVPPGAAVSTAPTVTSVTVSPTNATIYAGSMQQFNATVNGTNDPPQTVTWSITNAAAGTSISPAGLLIIGENQATGTYTVRATSTFDTTKSDTATVTVMPNVVTDDSAATRPSTPGATATTPPPAGTAMTSPPAPGSGRRDILDTSKQSLFAEIHFEPDTAILIESGRPRLEAAGRYLQANPGMWVLVRTYTAPFGTSEGRFMVALDRARFCRDYLLRNFGISPERIIVETLASERLPENVVIEEWITYRTAELIMIAE